MGTNALGLKGFLTVSILISLALNLGLSHSESLQIDSGLDVASSNFSSSNDTQELRRSDFPKDFIFGVATSAYQVEGAVGEGGRGTTIWDTFTNTPGKISDNTTAAVTADQYHHYEADVELIKELNMDAYRFSIAWSRIIPGIVPYVTLYHWDLPQPLEGNFGGWVNPEIVKHFTYFADTCFATFGDRVKHWITFNEPTQFCVNGYGTGLHAPGRTSDRTLSSSGNSSTEPYLAAHNVLIAHATVADIYRSNYKHQEGRIGFTIDCDWTEPLSDSEEDKKATERRRAFQLGWWLDPIFFGDYPSLMRQYVGDRLPQFTEAERSLLNNSLDFVGLNHYTTRWVTSQPLPLNPAQSNPLMDQGVLTTGVDEFNNGTLPIGDALKDTRRVNYYRDYIISMHQAIQNGADVRAYMAWSLLDNFEWAVGFTSRFGLYYVDYTTQKRYAKDSAKWFSNFLQYEDAYSEDRRH
ncbi:hypothetical protein R1flu_005313 [Riccia fluitans]|uniref:Beta-glucosidase n=1 Tax=Riccia fluitans TaxID=41844 RepID=A0ABD1YVK7_9MARC